MNRAQRRAESKKKKPKEYPIITLPKTCGIDDGELVSVGYKGGTFYLMKVKHEVKK